MEKLKSINEMTKILIIDSVQKKLTQNYITHLFRLVVGQSELNSFVKKEKIRFAILINNVY